MRSADRAKGGTWDSVRRAFAEFLLVPTCLIAGFILLSLGTYWVDREHAAWATPVRRWLQAYVFANPDATANLLRTIASGLITITSITVSLLLIALQQSASALTHQVYDQFLRNWHNQAYFGVFVGLSLYTLITLASVGPLNPVIGGLVALIFTVLALFLLLILFYTTVDQMRPVVIIGAIHKHALAARETQREFLRRTRRTPTLAGPFHAPVTLDTNGFLTAIDLEPITAAIRQTNAEVEVVVHVPIGSYVVFGQQVAEAVATTEQAGVSVATAVARAIRCEHKRDFASDPLDAVDELGTIGWTSISTAQSDADAGMLTIYGLRDVLARWAIAERSATAADAVPVVYPDNALPRLLDTFGSLAVSASESMQHQSCAEILRTFALLFDRLQPDERRRVEDIVMRMLSSLGDHVLTADLDSALDDVIVALARAGGQSTVDAVRAARGKLARSIGKLGSRATRAE